MGTTPLKLEGTNGDLKEMTTTEENYLAYQAGLHLSLLDSSDVATITQVSTNNTLIGTYTDTTFDDGPGTHGFQLGNVSSTQTTTSLYQRKGVTDFTGDSTAYRYPLEFINNGGTYEVHEFDSSELDTISDRLVGRIFSSEYPGVIRLGSSSPGGEWSIYKSNVFEDRLQTSVSGTVYNLYVKSSITPPTAVRPVSVKRSAGATGLYEGIQEMTDAEIRYTFGSRVQSRIMLNRGNISVPEYFIGTYQLRSSAQGAPTSTGTWSAKGSATDTRYDIVNVDYSATYTRDRQTTFTGNFSRSFTGNYARTRTSSFTGNYIGNFVGNYSRNFLGDYTGNYARNFLGNYVGNYARNFLGNYVGNYARAYSADYQRTRVTTYTGNFTGNYTGNYARGFATDFGRTSTRNSTTNFVGDFVGNYARTSTRTSTRVSSGAFTRNSIVSSSGGFVGDYIGLDPIYGTDTNFFRIRGSNFTGDFTGNYARNFSGNFAGNFVGDYARTRITTSTNNFAGDFFGNYVGNFARNFFANYLRTRVTDYVGNFLGNYVGNYSRNFSADYQRTRSSAYSADYQRTRSSAYSANYQRTRASTYTRTRATAFTRVTSQDYLGEYTTTRTSTYTTNFVGNFIGNYLGNYVGTTIAATTSTIETYTLYVRVA